jgi:hypothetical protein
MSVWVDASNPDVPPDMQEGLLGVRYCTLLSHQAILNWMLAESFEDEPVLITPKEGSDGACDEPSSWEPGGGSCFFFFGVANSSYFCADFTGVFFGPAEGAEKCGQSIYISDVTAYSEEPCSERTAELEAKIPDYVGLGGACVIKCQEDDEVIWNIYQADIESRCQAPYTLVVF